MLPGSILVARAVGALYMVRPRCSICAAQSISLPIQSMSFGFPELNLKIRWSLLFMPDALQLKIRWSLVIMNNDEKLQPAIAQLVEHLTVERCSYQMVPGSIPGGRTF